MVDWRILRDDPQEIAVWDEYCKYLRLRKVIAKQQRQNPPLSTDGVTPGPKVFLSALREWEWFWQLCLIAGLTRLAPRATGTEE